MTNTIMQFKQFMQNPNQYLQQMGVPQNLQNNPGAVIQHLMDNGKITQEQYNLLQLENLSGRLLQLASEVNSLDSSLSSLYGKLLIRDIEQGENIFTCLADMFHLVRADIVVDSGWMVRNECQRLSRAVQELHAMKNELR